MAYHKWDAEYWECEYKKLNITYTNYRNERYERFCEMQKELKALRERVSLFEKITRPIIFIEDGAVDNMPEYVSLLYCVVTYKRGYNAPAILPQIPLTK